MTTDRDHLHIHPADTIYTPGVRYTTTAAELIRILSTLPADREVITSHVASWKCACHPLANWSYYSPVAGCRISDLNYAKGANPPGGETYGENYATLKELQAAHGAAGPAHTPLMFTPADVIAENVSWIMYVVATRTEA